MGYSASPTRTMRSVMESIAGQAFQQGQHICAIYATEDEQLAVAAAYVTDGLEKGERCLYAAYSDAHVDRFRSSLQSAGVDVAAAERSGALLLRTKDQAHLSEGRFDSERMLRMLNEAVETALNDGFTGLRTCGDMSWLMDSPPGAHHVIEYEALLNQFFRHVRGLGMCQYDRRRMPEGLLEHAGIAAHSTVVIDAMHKMNPFFDPAPPESRGPNAGTIETKLSELQKPPSL